MHIFKRYILSAILVLVGIPGLANAALDDYFVQTDWLAKNRSQIVVLDARQTPFFLLGHIEGALHVARSEFLHLRGGIKGMVPTTIDFEVLMEKLGISPETTVVTYAEDNSPFAARLAWTLHYYGHDKVMVLDGGYQKWFAEDRPTSMLTAEAAKPSHYRVSVPGKTRAEADYILTQLGNPAVVVWDTRTPEEYSGRKVLADRGGHIPGATHLHWIELLHEVNSVKVLKSESEIRTLLTDHGITDEHEIVAHC